MIGRGGPFARAHSIAELGYACDLTPGVPAGANVTSVRNAPALFGDGLIEAIPDRVIIARAAAEKLKGKLGTPNLVRGPDGRIRVGRFGWKADIATLNQFVAQALRNELRGDELARPHRLHSAPVAQVRGRVASSRRRPTRRGGTDRMPQITDRANA